MIELTLTGTEADLLHGALSKARDETLNYILYLKTHHGSEREIEIMEEDLFLLRGMIRNLER